MAVILTGDRATVSNFRYNFFVGGFVSGFPKLPWITPFYKYLTPWCKTNGIGIFREAPLGIRKVESSLVHNGIDCKVVHPKYIEKHINDGDTLSVSCVDPLGTGPVPSMLNALNASASFSKVIRHFFNFEKNFLKIEFDKLMNQIKKVRRRKKFELVVGGPGAPYLSDKMEDYGIDYLYFGEAEIGFPDFIENGSSKRIIRGKLPKAEDIHPIVNPTDNRVEFSRGCGRGCKFCGPALKGRMRCISVEKIVEEVKVNQKNKNSYTILQSEDFLLYGADRNFVPQTDVIMDVFKSIFRETETSAIFPMHVSFSSILSNPDLIDKLSDLLKSRGQDLLASQPGIETGSTRLMKDLMPGKLLPFKDMEWKDVVLDSIKILERNGWYFVSTIITGLPGETEDDIRDTIDLVESMDYERGLIIPLFFSPVKCTSLEHKNAFFARTMKKEHWELIISCWKRNFKRISRIYRPLSKSNFTFSMVTSLGMESLSRLFHIYMKPFASGRIPNTL